MATDFDVLPAIGVSMMKDHHPTDLSDPVLLTTWLRHFDPQTATMPLWNAAQAFVRVPIASLLAYAGANDLGPGWQLVAAAAGAALAAAATSGKTATHASVAASPEPFTNIGISLAEDAFVLFIVWFATEHPFIAAAIVLVMLTAIVLAVRAIIRVLRRWSRGRPTLQPSTSAQ